MTLEDLLRYWTVGIVEKSNSVSVYCDTGYWGNCSKSYFKKVAARLGIDYYSLVDAYPAPTFNK